MLATLINTLAILVGGATGCLFRRALPRRMGDTVTAGLGLCVMVIGVSGALGTANVLIPLSSIVLGGLLGAWIGIEKRLARLGDRLQARFANGAGAFSKGFVSASLLFCVGAMAIVGSLDAGLRGAYQTLYAKSLLDCVSAVFLAAAYGAGVLLSAACVLVYQGAITLLSGVIAPVLSEAVIAEMSAAGGVLILGIGLNMLRDKHLPVGDLLPAILLPPLVMLLF